MTLLPKQIHSETNNQWRKTNETNATNETNERIHKLFYWGSNRRVLLKILPSRKNEMFMRNGNEIWDVLGDSRKRSRGPWAEIGKYWPGKEPIRLQDLLPCPLKNEGSEFFLSVIHCLKTQANNCTWDETCVCATFKVTEYKKLHEWRASGYFNFSLTV